MKILKNIAPLFILLLIAACSSSSTDDNPNSGSDDDNVVIAPEATSLIFPQNNTECNTGEIENVNQSWVTFEWNASDNTDSYEVNIVNLNTGNATRSRVNTTESRVLIARGTPYEWFVISESSSTNETATSETWRFYNEGPGIQNYSPFPAVAVNPNRGVNLEASTTEVALEWSASDVDNDIVSFEVFFGTDIVPTTSIAVTENTSIANVSVISGNTYYWRVVTIDASGNSSNSEVFEFKIL